MEPRERVRRMEQDGIITPSQAAMLRDSLASAEYEAAAPTAAAKRRIVPGWLLSALGAIAVVGLVLLATGGGDPATVQDVAETMNQPGAHGEMNKSLSTVLAVLILLAIPLGLWVWLHNSLVSKEERVFESWAQTESNFQRRADLIPALVDTVTRYLKHESETLIGVTEARGEALNRLTGAVDELIRAQQESRDLMREQGAKIIEEEATLAKLYESQAIVGRSMQSLLAVVEDYPDLRSSDQFLELQAQIEGTENRINVARMRFNDAVREYNAAIRKLPGSLVAGVGNFQRKGYFQSDQEAKNAPELQFN